MRGNRTVLYRVWEVVLLAAALAGMAAMVIFMLRAGDRSVAVGWICAAVALVGAVFPLGVFVHELGHLFFGFLAGMRLSSFSVGILTISVSAAPLKISFRNGLGGYTQMYPTRASARRGAFMLYTLGGILFNVLYAALFLTLLFVFPKTTALYFFELFAPLSLFEGLVALYPVTLSDGKTDGEVFSCLRRSTPDGDVLFRVFRAQAILYRKEYTAIPEELLFNAPAIREDDGAFFALTQLRWHYLFYAGRWDEAAVQLMRLRSLEEYLSEDAVREVEYDCICASLLVKGKELFPVGEETLAALSSDRTESAARYRAVAVISEGKKRREAVARAEAFLNKIPQYGIRMLEKKFLCTLRTEEPPVTSAQE